MSPANTSSPRPSPPGTRHPHGAARGAGRPCRPGPGGRSQAVPGSAPAPHPRSWASSAAWERARLSSPVLGRPNKASPLVALPFLSCRYRTAPGRSGPLASSPSRPPTCSGSALFRLLPLGSTLMAPRAWSTSRHLRSGLGPGPQPLGPCLPTPCSRPARLPSPTAAPSTEDPPFARSSGPAPPRLDLRAPVCSPRARQPLRPACRQQLLPPLPAAHTPNAPENPVAWPRLAGTGLPASCLPR